MDKWSLLRLFSVQSNLEDSVVSLKENLLRYGYLVKANLPVDVRKQITDVEYSFSKMNEPTVILHFDLTSNENIVSVMDYYNVIVELIGEDKIGIYEYNDTDLIFHIRV